MQHNHHVNVNNDSSVVIWVFICELQSKSKWNTHHRPFFKVFGEFYLQKFHKIKYCLLPLWRSCQMQPQTLEKLVPNFLMFPSLGILGMSSIFSIVLQHFCMVFRFKSFLISSNWNQIRTMLNQISFFYFRMRLIFREVISTAKYCRGQKHCL